MNFAKNIEYCAIVFAMLCASLLLYETGKYT